MANTITGKIYFIGDVVSIPSKNGGQPFLKRDLILDATRFDPYTGERDRFENFPLIEFGGDKCKELDALQVGQVVKVSFNLQGGFFEIQDGKTKNFTSVRGYAVEAIGRNAFVPQTQQVQQAPQQQYLAAPQAAPPQPQGNTPPPPTARDLPF